MGEGGKGQGDGCEENNARIYRPSFRETTSRKRSFSMTENEHFGLVFAKTGSINSGTGEWGEEEGGGEVDGMWIDGEERACGRKGRKGCCTGGEGRRSEGEVRKAEGTNEDLAPMGEGEKRRVKATLKGRGEWGVQGEVGVHIQLCPV